MHLQRPDHRMLGGLDTCRSLSARVVIHSAMLLFLESTLRIIIYKKGSYVPVPSTRQGNFFLREADRLPWLKHFLSLSEHKINTRPWDAYKTDGVVLGNFQQNPPRPFALPACVTASFNGAFQIPPSPPSPNHAED